VGLAAGGERSSVRGITATKARKPNTTTRGQHELEHELGLEHEHEHAYRFRYA
jgi:hypothetical protein